MKTIGTFSRRGNVGIFNIGSLEVETFLLNKPFFAIEAVDVKRTSILWRRQGIIRICLRVSDGEKEKRISVPVCLYRQTKSAVHIARQWNPLFVYVHEERLTLRRVESETKVAFTKL